MAKKKQRSKVEQRFSDWLDSLQEGGTVHRMLSSWAASTILQEERPGWFWACVIALLIVFILPMCLYSFVLEQLGHTQLTAWENLFFLIGFLSSLFAGIGTINLFMLPLEKLCAQLLHKDFPNGFDIPFYLGHKVTFIFLLGCGTLSAACIACIHLL